jgi:hypothetical protein
LLNSWITLTWWQLQTKFLWILLVSLLYKHTFLSLFYRYMQIEFLYYIINLFLIFKDLTILLSKAVFTPFYISTSNAWQFLGSPYLCQCLLSIFLVCPSSLWIFHCSFNLHLPNYECWTSFLILFGHLYIILETCGPNILLIFDWDVGLLLLFTQQTFMLSMCLIFSCFEVLKISFNLWRPISQVFLLPIILLIFKTFCLNKSYKGLLLRFFQKFLVLTFNSMIHFSIISVYGIRI